jgi:hypothetical protein
MSDWSFVILSEKKDEKASAVAEGVDFLESRCRIEFIAFQSLRESVCWAAMRFEWYSRLAVRIDL